MKKALSTALVGTVSLVATKSDFGLPLHVSALSVASTLTRRRKTGFRSKTPLYQYRATIERNNDAINSDTISTPVSLLEEEMLSGSEQSILVEMVESKRRKIWKQLEKADRLVNKSNSKTLGGGFGGGGFAGKTKTGKGKKSSTKKSADGESTAASQLEKEHSALDLKKDKSNFGAQIVEQGVARINQQLSKETARILLEFVNGYLEEALTTKVEDLSLEEIYKQQPYFADVREKLNRWDMLLPLEDSDAVQNALRELLVENSVLSDSIEAILGSSAQLYELGALISDPGSERQLLHADYNYQPDFQPKIPPALTCFVALQDIDESMGPTTFLPSTATEEYHEEIAIGQADDYGDGKHRSKLLSSTPNQLALLDTGDCALYNPMTLHCGGANRSQKRRIIFYFSFKNKKYDEKDWPLAYASLRSDLRARALTLTDMKSIVSKQK